MNRWDSLPKPRSFFYAHLVEKDLSLYHMSELSDDPPSPPPMSGGVTLGSCASVKDCSSSKERKRSCAHVSDLVARGGDVNTVTGRAIRVSERRSYTAIVT